MNVMHGFQLNVMTSTITWNSFDDGQTVQFFFDLFVEQNKRKGDISIIFYKSITPGQPG